MNGLDFGTAIGLIKGLNSPDPAVIEGAVSDWLDDHPEATTTVQDGSITKAKLDSNLQGTVDDVANLKSQMETYDNLFGFYVPPVYSNKILVIDYNGNIGYILDESINDNKLYGKTFSIVGDSISTYVSNVVPGYNYYYPTGNVDSVDKTWWKMLANEMGMIILSNASWSGSKVSGDSTGTAQTGCSTARVNDIAGTDNTAPDIILVYISTNDWAFDVQLGSFDSTDDIPSEGVIQNIADAYALLLYKIRTTYPLAKLYCITNLEGRLHTNDTTYPIVNVHRTTIHQVNHAVAEIAHIFGATVIDLQTCGIHYWNISSYTVDGNLHPNAAGMELIKNVVKATLLATM